MVTREEINIIIQKMSVYLGNIQMIKLQEILAGVSDNTDIEDVKSSEELLELFIAVKRLEGRSELTLGLYKHNIEKLLASVDKNVCLLNTDDIRAFLSDYRREKGISKVTLDNMRRNLQLLGHEKIDTTLRYAQVKQNNVKMSHKKYFG